MVNSINNPVKSMTFVKINLEHKNRTGRSMPVEIPNSKFDLEFDTVIPAIGQDADFNFIEKNYRDGK
jgi:formate dehydrogenase (NADP+) beta subunit